MIVPVSWFFALSYPLILSRSIFLYGNMAGGAHWKDALQSAALVLDIAQHICDTYGSRLRFPTAWFTSPIAEPYIKACVQLYENISCLFN